MNSHDLLAIPEAAVAGKMCQRQLYKLIGDGTIKAVKAGRRTFVPRSEVERYLGELPELRPVKAAPRTEKLEPPLDMDLESIVGALGLSAEIVGPNGSKCVAVVSASPFASELLVSLGNASTWLAAWMRVVEGARTRLLTTAQGGVA